MGTCHWRGEVGVEVRKGWGCDFNVLVAIGLHQTSRRVINIFILLKVGASVANRVVGLYVELQCYCVTPWHTINSRNLHKKTYKKNSRKFIISQSDASSSTNCSIRRKKLVQENFAQESMSDVQVFFVQVDLYKFFERVSGALVHGSVIAVLPIQYTCQSERDYKSVITQRSCF